MASGPHPEPRRCTRWSAGLAAILVAVSTGCDFADSEPIDREIAEAVLLDNMGLALQVEQAVDRVARVCMEELGFLVHPLETEYPEQYDETSLLRRDVYTEPDLSLPTEEIYGVSVDSRAFTIVVSDEDGENEYLDPDPFTALPAADQDDYFAAYYGSAGMTPEVLDLPELDGAQRAAGGCMREAEDVLTGDEYPDYLNHAALAGAKGGTDWEDDDRVVEARLEWAECMGEHGYDYELPFEVYTHLFRSAADLNHEWRVGGTVTKAGAESELAALTEVVATADASCHNRADLQQAQVDVYWEYWIAYVSDHEEELYAFKDRVDDILILAQDIIESGLLPA